ncbi:hypothetical protein N7453_011461 [Penicillium expansum]|nr:hypothetical protein N7453_011461 [Penicillium expansum]
MPPKGKYSNPKLRDEIKKEVHDSDKGGKPGQWSARKVPSTIALISIPWYHLVWILILVQAQMMASEYKRRGGGYNTTKEKGQTESQKHLDTWTNEEWQTKEGSGTARQDDDSRKRYLPKKAWEKLNEEEKEQTEENKIDESQGGKQYVSNTTEAKEARRWASSDNGDEGQKVEGDSGKVQWNKEAGKQRTKKNEEEKTDNKQNDNKQSDDKQNGDKQNDDKQNDDKQNDDKQNDDKQNDDKQNDDKQNDDKQNDDKQNDDKQNDDKQNDDKQNDDKQNDDKQNDDKQDDDNKGGAGTKRSAKQDEVPKKKQKDSARMSSLRERK